jgi:hypothetical protein
MFFSVISGFHSLFSELIREHPDKRVDVIIKNKRSDFFIGENI